MTFNYGKNLITDLKKQLLDQREELGTNIKNSEENFDSYKRIFLKS